MGTLRTTLTSSSTTITSSVYKGAGCTSQPRGLGNSQADNEDEKYKDSNGSTAETCHNRGPVNNSGVKHPEPDDQKQEHDTEVISRIVLTVGAAPPGACHKNVLGLLYKHFAMAASDMVEWVFEGYKLHLLSPDAFIRPTGRGTFRERPTQSL